MMWIQVWSWYLFDETNVPEVSEPMDPVSEAAGATIVAGVGKLMATAVLLSVAAKNIILHN